MISLLRHELISVRKKLVQMEETKKLILEELPKIQAAYIAWTIALLSIAKEKDGK